MKTWKIYKHENLINGKIYIGQTCQSLKERWRNNGKGYAGNSPVFYTAIQKYGWDNFSHTIIEDNILTLEEAYEREKYWIKYYDCCLLDGKGKGYNIDRGGKGFSSEKASELSKQNWKDEEYRAKFCKKVICLNTQKIYNSIVEAANNTGINKTGIAKNCAHVHKSAGTDNEGKPLIWEFYDETKDYSQYNYDYINKKLKKVICTTTGKIYNSIEEASQEIGICRSSISQCCTHERKTAGMNEEGIKLCWEYYEEGKEYKYATGSGKNNKRVKCITTNQIFESIKEGAESVNRKPANLSAHLHGRVKSCGKTEDGTPLVWEFIDESNE